jgi:hypothetical protein
VSNPTTSDLQVEENIFVLKTHHVTIGVVNFNSASDRRIAPGYNPATLKTLKPSTTLTL